jgi:hypothetical protein
MFVKILIPICGRLFPKKKPSVSPVLGVQFQCRIIPWLSHFLSFLESQQVPLKKQKHMHPQVVFTDIFINDTICFTSVLVVDCSYLWQFMLVINYHVAGYITRYIWRGNWQRIEIKWPISKTVNIIQYLSIICLQEVGATLVILRTQIAFSWVPQPLCGQCITRPK